MDILIITEGKFCLVISLSHKLLCSSIFIRELSMLIFGSFLLLACLHIGIAISTKLTQIFLALMT